MDAVHGRLAGVPARPTRRLDLEVVAAPGVDPNHGPRARGADPLLGRLVALHLGHRCLVSLRSSPQSAGLPPRWSWGPPPRCSVSVPRVPAPVATPPWPRPVSPPSQGHPLDAQASAACLP